MTQLKKLAAWGVLAAVLLLSLGAYAVFRAPAEASAPIAAIPLATTDAAASATGGSATTAPAAGPETTTATTTDSAATTTAATTSNPVALQIVPDESEARFVIDEVLNSAPKTVVGATNQVAGEIAVDSQDPAKTRVGVIQVNARALATDSEFRNRAIKNRILLTDQYEFITFTPTAITGLPATGAVGATYTFQITGDLTIRDVTKPVTFDVRATPISESRLEGAASTTIRYADWGLTIPQVPQVASVSDEVRLEIDFVAVPN